MRFDGVRLEDKYLCACLLEVVPWQMSLCKCQLIKAVPMSSVLDRCWTHQLTLKLALSYRMEGCDERYVQIDKFVLWALTLLRKLPYLCAELEGWASDITAGRFLSHVTTWLLKKSQIILFSFHFTLVVSHWEIVSDIKK